MKNGDKIQHKSGYKTTVEERDGVLGITNPDGVWKALGHYDLKEWTKC